MDLDGCILDSMPVWLRLGRDYLRTYGLEAEENLSRRLAPMSLAEGAAYLHRRYLPERSPETIQEDLVLRIRDFYANDAPLKEGAERLLRLLKAAAIPIYLLSATPEAQIRAALRRLAVRRFFDRIYSSHELKRSKSDPLLYQELARQAGEAPACCWVLEDSVHAIRAAKKAGFRSLAIYDEASEENSMELRAEADVYLENWRDFRIQMGAGSFI